MAAADSLEDLDPREDSEAVPEASTVAPVAASEAAEAQAEASALPNPLAEAST